MQLDMLNMKKLNIFSLTSRTSFLQSPFLGITWLHECMVFSIEGDKLLG